MTRWEFHEVTIYNDHASSGRREMEERGRKGWQIGGVVRNLAGDSTTFFLQRHLPPEADDLEILSCRVQALELKAKRQASPSESDEP